VNLNPQLIITIIGIVFIGLGIAARMGAWKKWYWRTRGGAYGYVPMGCLFVVYAYEEAIIQSVQQSGLIAIYIVLAVLVIYLSLRPPKWIKPTWIRWIEEQSPASQKAMRNFAKDDDDWMLHVNTRDAVQKWAKQLKK
jgi:hypothetical protein